MLQAYPTRTRLRTVLRRHLGAAGHSVRRPIVRAAKSAMFRRTSGDDHFSSMAVSSRAAWRRAALDQGPADGFLRPRKGRRGDGRQFFGDFAGAGDQPLGLDQFVHQAVGQCVVRLVGATRAHERGKMLWRRGETDDFERPGGKFDPHANFRQAHVRPSPCENSLIAAEHEDRAAGDRVPIDGRHERLGKQNQSLKVCCKRGRNRRT